MPKVILPPWEDLINESFIPDINNTDRYLIEIGGRGSGKSDFAAKKLIYRCMTESYFRYILYRKVYNTIEESQYANIKDIIYEWKLESLFTFTTKPLAIRCMNGNRFICRGGDDSTKLKSIKDPTGVWYEEEIPDESDFITITSSIRTTRAKYLQEIFTVNPEVEGDHKEHWFWKRFFEEKAPGTSYRDNTMVHIPATRWEPEKDVELTYCVHHSTHEDNRFLPDVFRAQLLSMRDTNEYYYTIYVLGLWGNRIIGDLFYPKFTRAKQVRTARECSYNKALPLRITFDFNTQPYVTLNVHQLYDKKSVQIDEITLRAPNNRTMYACQEFCRRYKDHTSGVIVYGDPAGRHEDTRTELGYNDFLAIQKELFTFRPQMRYRNVAPSVSKRGQFLNTIFSVGYEGIEIIISDKCTDTIADYLFLKEKNNEKAKIVIKNKETGISYQQYGHTSDANDYYYCEIYASEFAAFCKGPIVVVKHKAGKSSSANSY